jgi:hypothetical protein
LKLTTRGGLDYYFYSSYELIVVDYVDWNNDLDSSFFSSFLSSYCYDCGCFDESNGMKLELVLLYPNVD